MDICTDVRLRFYYSRLAVGEMKAISIVAVALLAAPSTNTLRTDYQADEYDAHPNELANHTIGPLFADFIDQAIRTYTAR